MPRFSAHSPIACSGALMQTIRRIPTSKVRNQAAYAPAFLVIATLFLLVPAACAQELGTGVIRGEVLDPQSALVHGAQVTAFQETTGLQRTTTTSNSGLFPVTDLPPAAYNLKAPDR